MQPLKILEKKDLTMKILSIFLIALRVQCLTTKVEQVVVVVVVGGLQIVLAYQLVQNAAVFVVRIFVEEERGRMIAVY